MIDNREALRIAIIERIREGKFNNLKAAHLLGRTFRP